MDIIALILLLLIAVVKLLDSCVKCRIEHLRLLRETRKGKRSATNRTSSK